MARSATSLTTRRSPEEVFDLLTDMRNSAGWDPNVVRVEMVSDGPVGPGSAFDVTVAVGPRSMTLRYHVQDYDRPHRVVLEARSKLVHSRDTVTVAAGDEGTTVVTYDAELAGVGLGVLFDPLLGPALRRIFAQAAPGLAGRLDAAPADPVTGPSPGPSDRPAGGPTPGSAPARLVDAALEATVVGSFSRLGPAVRRRTDHWADPPDAAGRVVVVTGATGGLGQAAAVRLASLGAEVLLVGRNAQRTEATRRVVAAAAQGRPVHTEIADLSDLTQVRALARRLADRLDRLDVVVHNAGALLAQRQETAQGIEATLAVHLLGPFVLTEELVGLLERSAPSRVLTMTSGGMYTQRFDLGDLEMGDGNYDGTVAYARAKRAQVVLTAEWQRRYGARGIDFYAVHPGWADTPGLAESLPGFHRLMGPILRRPEQGVDTVVWLAGQPAGTPPGGGLWLDRRPRGAYRLPWTVTPTERRAAEGEDLWAWCRARTAE